MKHLIISAIIATLLALAQSVPAPSHRNSRIYGGEEAEPHSIPYIVAVHPVVFENDTATEYFLTDGVLITPSAVLTAATIYSYDILSIRMYFGAHEITPFPDTEIFRTVNVSDVIIHPGYSENNTFVNNLAILRLREPVNLTDIVNVVPLPFTADNDYVGDLATVSGWGASGDSPIESPTLQKLEIEVAPNSECRNGALAEHILCTPFGDGKSVCGADLGGPLVASTGELIGIIIASEADCEFGLTTGPSYYTRITSHLSWIAENV